ncbi:MAG: hypothetical protein K5919_10165 [Clostridiales bacterium]|nr:hypothetical protein [Clostridiales bacterium]
MPKSVKSRTPMSSRSKGAILLAVLLALIVFVSVISITGLCTGENGMNELLPWVPVSSRNWPEALHLNRAMGGGTYYEYTAALPEGSEGDLAAETENAVKVMGNRIKAASSTENDGSVTLKDGVIRLEIGKMTAAEITENLNRIVAPGKLEIKSSDNVVLTEKDVEQAGIGYNSARTRYALNLTLTKEGQQKLADSGAIYLNVFFDGTALSYYATASGNVISATLGDTQAEVDQGARAAFLLNSGAINVDLTKTAEGALDASSASVKSVSLIVAAVLLACALVYLVMKGKLTGIAGILTVWCALELMLFLTAAVVLPTANVYSLTLGGVAAILLSLLLAIYTAVTRTEAISRQISENASAGQAVRFGFKASARNIWIVHGVALAVAAVLMLLPFSRIAGYVLGAGVASSAITAWLMRVFLYCFVSINGKTSLYGAAK